MKITCMSPQRLKIWTSIASRLMEQAKLGLSWPNQAQGTKPPSISRVKSPILDVVTRWNSTMYMLQRALEFRGVIDELCSAPGYPIIYHQYRLTTEDWEIIAKVCDWLKV